MTNINTVTNMLTKCQIKGIIDYSICTNLKINCFLQQLQQQQPQPLQQLLQHPLHAQTCGLKISAIKRRKRGFVMMIRKHRKIAELHVNYAILLHQPS